MTADGSALDRTDSDGAWALRVFLAALLCRALFVLSTSGLAHYQHLMGDAEYFDAYSWLLAWGRLENVPIEITLSPVYLAFLAAIYRVVGHHVVAVRILQAVAGSVTCVLLYHYGRRAFGRTVGTLAGFGAAFYGIFIFYDAEVLKPCLTNLLLAGSLCLFHGGRGRPGWRTGCAGLLLSTAILLRMDLLLPFGLILCWVWSCGRQYSNLAAAGALALVVSGSVANGVLWHAWYEAQAPRQTAMVSQAGIHFFIGNQPNATGTYQQIPGVGNGALGHNRDTRRIVEEEQQRCVSIAAVNAYWIEKGLRFIVSEPLQWFWILGKKTFLLFNAFEIPSTEDYDYSRGKSWFLGLPLLSFSVVSPLGLLGLWLSRKDRAPAVQLLRRLFFGYACAQLLMIVRADYRLPLHLPLLLFASFAVTALWDEAKVARGKMAVHVLALLALCLFTNHETFLDRAYYASFTEGRIQRGVREQRWRAPVRLGARDPGAASPAEESREPPLCRVR